VPSASSTLKTSPMQPPPIGRLLLILSPRCSSIPLAKNSSDKFGGGCEDLYQQVPSFPKRSGQRNRPGDRFPSPRHDVTPWSASNREPLCQASLSIGLYLLLEGPVPTKELYPPDARPKPLFFPKFHFRYTGCASSWFFAERTQARRERCRLRMSSSKPSDASSTRSRTCSKPSGPP
jgi:hypothetical protein